MKFLISVLCSISKSVRQVLEQYKQILVSLMFPGLQMPCYSNRQIGLILLPQIDKE